MKFSSKVLAVGAIAVAGVALVGVGAGASFTDAVSATQHIDTGTLVMNINSPDGTQSADAHSVTWSISNSGSAINQNHVITLSNNGTLPLSITSLTISDPGSGTPLASELNATLANLTGSLAGLEATSYVCSSDCVLAPGATTDIPFALTADLSNKAEGQTVEPTLTFSAVEANPSAHAAATALPRAMGFAAKS